MDEGFKAFLAQPRHTMLHSVEKPEPMESTLQLVKTTKALQDATLALRRSNEEQGATREAITRLIDAIQSLVDGREYLQALEQRALNGLLKELGIDG